MELSCAKNLSKKALRPFCTRYSNKNRTMKEKKEKSPSTSTQIGAEFLNISAEIEEGHVLRVLGKAFLLSNFPQSSFPKDEVEGAWELWQERRRLKKLSIYFMLASFVLFSMFLYGYYLKEVSPLHAQLAAVTGPAFIFLGFFAFIIFSSMLGKKQNTSTGTFWGSTTKKIAKSWNPVRKSIQTFEWVDVTASPSVRKNFFHNLVLDVRRAKPDGLEYSDWAGLDNEVKKLFRLSLENTHNNLVRIESRMKEYGPESRAPIAEYLKKIKTHFETEVLLSKD